MRIRHLAAHLLLACAVLACTPLQATPSMPTVPEEWEGVPVMPGATAVDQERLPNAYQYSVNADVKAVQRYYLDAMETAGWELLGKGDMSGSDMKSLALWYSSGESIRSIQIWQQDKVTQVAIIKDR